MLAKQYTKELHVYLESLSSTLVLFFKSALDTSLLNEQKRFLLLGNQTRQLELALVEFVREHTFEVNCSVTGLMSHNT